MRVAELREKLSNLDPNLEVLCYTEDPELRASGEAFRLLDIRAVTTPQAEPVRLDTGRPSLKFGQSSASEEFLVLEVTSNF